MTIADLQELLDGADAVITYAGPAPYREGFAVTIEPKKDAWKWKHKGMKLRGKGETLEEALEEALTQLAVFAMDKLGKEGPVE